MTTSSTSDESLHEPQALAGRVLIVEDDVAMRTALSRILQRAGFEVTTAPDGKAGLEQLVSRDFDAALVDVNMPRMSGAELLAEAKRAQITTEIIVMTAFAEIDIAVSAIRAGAFEFLTKPFASNEAVAIAVRNATQRRRLTLRAEDLEKALERERGAAPAMIGRSPAMLSMLRLVDGVAPTSSTVLILGESGTGKELVAQAVHARSRRSDKPFITVNCAAIPKELVESELFGHVRGAFTGAQTARTGLFEAAHGGTIFLDEVGDLPIGAQVKLLRTLQSGEVRRVGSDSSTVVDVRVVAATNADLKAAIDAGTFRRDFYYRLNVVTINMPPLRERRRDIPLLAYEFLTRFAKSSGRSVARIAPDAMRALEAYDWPGNIRELEHAIEHAVILSRGDEIVPDVLPFLTPPSTEATLPPPADAVASPAHVPSADFVPLVPPITDHNTIDATPLLELPYTVAKGRAVAAFNAIYVRTVLARADANVSEAARLAGLDRSNFRRILRALSEPDDG